MKKVILFILAMFFSISYGVAQESFTKLGKIDTSYSHEGEFNYDYCSGIYYLDFETSSKISGMLFIKMKNNVEDLNRALYCNLYSEQGEQLNNFIISRQVIDGVGIILYFEIPNTGKYSLGIGIDEYTEWINYHDYHYIINFSPTINPGAFAPGIERTWKNLVCPQEFNICKIEGQTIDIMFTAPQPKFSMIANMATYTYEESSEQIQLEVKTIDNLHSLISLPPELYGDLCLTLCSTGTPNNLLVPFDCTIKCLPQSTLDSQFYESNDEGASIRTRTFRNSNGKEYIDAIEHYDGLGFPVQRTLVKGTSSEHDIVTLKEYDELGRETKNWLPVIAPAGGKCWTEQSLKNNAKLYYGDNYAYNLTIYEKSPREKIERQYGPGYTWHTYKNNRFTAYDNIPNDITNHACIHYHIHENGMLEKLGYYPKATLLASRVTDENGNVTYEFKNSQAQTVLTQAVNGDEKLDTYYVYDHKGNLRYVLPPMIKATDILSDESENMKRYAYLYRYDHRNRCIAKRLPGCDWTLLAYDKSNYAVFTQDGIQRSKKEWAFSIPDASGREVLSGLCKDTVDVSQNYIIAEYTSTGTYEGYAIRIDNITTDLTLDSLLHVSYYDTYDFLSRTGFEDLKCDNILYVKRYGDDTSQSRYKHAGLLTGNIVAQLSGTGKLRSALYYDNRQRVIQSKSSNHLGGIDTETYDYNFSDQITTQYHKHTTPGNLAIQEHTFYTYDHAGRLKNTHHQVNDREAFTLTINSYDELGRISSQLLNNQIEEIQYDYNIRNQLSGIQSRNFEQALHYADGMGAACFNGNISSMTWKVTGDSLTRGYKLSYDALSRLTNAEYGEGVSLDQHTGRFNEQVTGYDKLGNILGLKRYGRTSGTGYGLIDNLNMTYEGNQLKTVTDNTINSAYANDFEFKDGANLPVEYLYDANGNLTQDLNKKITNIQYNCLNLPCRIQFEDGNSISYLYDANGTKLRTTHLIDGVTTTTDYCGNAIYENGVLEKLLTEGAYITLADTIYHCYLQDHQGNNRLVVNQNGTVEEVNNYYPFGGVFASPSSIQSYKYNGKELDTKNGLNWYDYGARHYDAAIGRWHTVDPLSEMYYESTPYLYCGADPINNIDPFGMDYWSTSNPEEIKRFINTITSIPNAGGSFSESFNFSSWNHSTDGEFLSNLTFNDETNMFYSSYGIVENGTPTRVGISMPALGRNDNSAWIEGAKSRWGNKASGRLENKYPEFDLFFASTKAGWSIAKSMFSSMFRPLSTTNTFDANKSGFTQGGSNKEKMGTTKGNMSGNHDVQNKQIDNLCTKYKLDKTQRRAVHDLIGGQGYGYHEIEQLIKDYFNK